MGTTILGIPGAAHKYAERVSGSILGGNSMLMIPIDMHLTAGR